MTSEEKWDALRNWICAMDISAVWHVGGGWDSAMIEVLVKMEGLDNDTTFKGAKEFVRITKKYNLDIYSPFFDQSATTTTTSEERWKELLKGNCDESYLR